MKYAVWCLIDDKPGCVDYLGTVEASTINEAEDVARLMYPRGDGERIEVEEDDVDE